MEVYERIREIRKHFFHDNNTEFANFMGEKLLQQVDGLVDVEVLEDLSLIKLPTKYQE